MWMFSLLVPSSLINWHQYICNLHKQCLPSNCSHWCVASEKCLYWLPAQLPNIWWGKSWSLTVSPTKFKRKLYLTMTIYTYHVKNIYFVLSFRVFSVDYHLLALICISKHFIKLSQNCHSQVYLVSIASRFPTYCSSSEVTCVHKYEENLQKTSRKSVTSCLYLHRRLFLTM